MQLPVEKKEPKSTAAEVRKVAAKEARTAVSAPVRLGTGKTKLSVSEEALAANTEFVAASSGKLKPKVDGRGLARDIGSELARLETRSRNATIAVHDDEPTITPSKA
ncbi:MAG: hypothetical protein GEV04_24475, partial [Actinophytocola sp.]|nr:hypothetical protein [Actinophytocola sp.]